MSEPEYVVEHTEHVRLIRINRPERMNTLSKSLRIGLVEEFLRGGEDPDVRAIVLTGTGDRAFCAGADLKEVNAGDTRGDEFRPPLSRHERSVIEVITEIFKPVIVALNGPAIGGGFEMALASDIRIAAEGAYLQLPEARIGMGAIFGSVLLPKRIPVGIALEKLFTGDQISPEEALRWGLINRIVPRARLMDETMELAARIAANAPITVRRMKEMAIKGLELPLWSALRLDVGPNPYTAEDRKEGIQAFLEKRKPVWKNR